MFEDEYRSMTVSEGPGDPYVPAKLALPNPESSTLGLSAQMAEIGREVNWKQ